MHSCPVCLHRSRVQIECQIAESIGIGIQPMNASRKPKFAGSNHAGASTSFVPRLGEATAATTAASVDTSSSAITIFMVRSSVGYRPIRSSTMHVPRITALHVVTPSSTPIEPKSAVASAAVTIVTPAMMMNMAPKVTTAAVHSAHRPRSRYPSMSV